MKRTHRLYSSILAMVAMSMASTSCDSLIYDDLKDCPQELVFHFFRQTPCESQPYYPREIREVRLFAFNEADVLTDEFSATGLTLSGDYRMTVPFDHQGDFTFVAWGAASFQDYALTAFQKGTTTRQQLLLAMKHAAGEVTTLPAPLFHGAATTPVSRHYGEEEGTHRDTVDVNMAQLTNDITLTVHGLDLGSYDYDLYITDDNDTYDAWGRIVDGRPPFRYTSPIDNDGQVLRARFTTLKLEEGRGTRLVISNKTTGEEVFSTRLVDDLIMYRSALFEPPYSLECDHRFIIVVVLEKDTTVITGETYMAVRANINNWNVVFREAVFN